MSDPTREAGPWELASVGKDGRSQTPFFLKMRFKWYLMYFFQHMYGQVHT